MKFLLLGILLIIPIVFSSAQTAQEIRDKINEKDSAIEKLEKEIASYQSQIDGLVQQKDSLNNSLKELDLTKKKLNADISLTQNKISKTNLEIQNLSKNIGNKEGSIKNNLDSIALEIRNVNEFEQSDLLETMLSDDGFSAVWNDIDNIVTVRERLREGIISLKQQKGELEDTRKVTVDAKNKLTALKSQLSDQQKIVVQNANEKSKLLAQTKNSEANYQKLLKDRIAQRDAFEKELRDYEAQLQFIIDPSKLPSGRVLSWPLTNIFITQQFGKTVDAKRLYTSGTHNGVDFRAAMGTPVMAMADGKVMGVGDTDLTCYGASFGKFVFIEYENGLSSTFGHLSLIKVKEGTKVKRGAVVAYSGNTGHSTGPHLHVSLYAAQAAKMASKETKVCFDNVKGVKVFRKYRLPVASPQAYLNVLDYLPGTVASMFKK